MQFAVIEAIALATPPAPLSWGTSGAVIAALVASAALCAAGLAFDQSRPMSSPQNTDDSGTAMLYSIGCAPSTSMNTLPAGVSTVG